MEDLMAKFEMKALMFGKSGVGKSSLLAAMYNSLRVSDPFEDIVAKSEASGNDLDAILDELKRYIRAVEDGNPVGIPSTTTKKTFNYNLGINQPGFGHTLDLAFTDIPGEWLTQTEKKVQCEQLFRDSDIVIVAISTPAMMEENREYNSESNSPEKFKDFLHTLADAKSVGTKYFFLVPLKAEKYFTNPNLITSLKEVYKHHRTLIAQKGHVCYALPINTLGSVIFDRFELDEAKRPVEIFKLKTKGINTWQPENHDVLAAHILSIGLKKLHSSFPMINAITDKASKKLDPLLKATILEFPDKEHFIKFEEPATGGNGCFYSDSLIRLADFSQMPISQIKPGMRVLSVTSSGEFEAQKVTRTLHKKNKALLEIVFSDATCIRVTPEHLIQTENSWLASGKLKPGDKVISLSSDKRSVTKCVAKISQDMICSDAYNIYVEKNSNFFADDTLVSCYSFLRRSRNLIEKCRNSCVKVIEGFSYGKQ